MQEIGDALICKLGNGLKMSGRTKISNQLLGKFSNFLIVLTTLLGNYINLRYFTSTEIFLVLYCKGKKIPKLMRLHIVVPIFSCCAVIIITIHHYILLDRVSWEPE